MTIQEKTYEIRKYCRSKRHCTFEQEYPCPLYKFTGACSDGSDELIERNFKLVSAMPDYKGKRETDSLKDKTTDELNGVIQKYCGQTGCSECRVSSVCNRIRGNFRDEKNREELEEAYLILHPDTEPKTNNVNHPSHYNQGGMECIDEMVLIFGKEATMNFCLCNAWKYRYRANAKNGQEDLEKANWYIAKYKELKETV